MGNRQGTKVTRLKSVADLKRLRLVIKSDSKNRHSEILRGPKHLDNKWNQRKETSFLTKDLICNNTTFHTVGGTISQGIY